MLKPLPAALLTMITLVTAIAAPDAPAITGDIRLASNGAVACQAQSEASSRDIYFSNLYALNTANADRVLTCELPLWRDDNSVYLTGSGHSQFATVGIVNTIASEQTFGCTAQTSQGTGSSSYLVLSKVVPAQGYDYFTFDAPVLALQDFNYAGYLSCLLPPGGKLVDVMVYSPTDFVR